MNKKGEPMLKVYFTGGPDNNSYENSIGGLMSTHEVKEGRHLLFEDLPLQYVALDLYNQSNTFIHVHSFELVIKSTSFVADPNNPDLALGFDLDNFPHSPKDELPLVTEKKYIKSIEWIEPKLIDTFTISYTFHIGLIPPRKAVRFILECNKTLPDEAGGNLKMRFFYQEVNHLKPFWRKLIEKIKNRLSEVC